MDDFYIKRVCEGDTAAFNYFLNKYKDMSFSIAIAVVKDPFIAQEVVQDAFVKAYQHLSSFSHASAFSTWFYRIVTNEALMRLRKLKREIIELTSDYGEEPVDDQLLSTSNEEEQTYLINEALQKLPAKESLALRLFYLQEESVKEVCEITGWSEANTKVILYRARKNMFTVLTQLMKTDFYNG